MDTKLTFEDVTADLAELDPVLVLEQEPDGTYRIQLIPEVPALQFYSLDEVTAWIAADRLAGA